MKFFDDVKCLVVSVLVIAAFSLNLFACTCFAEEAHVSPQGKSLHTLRFGHFQLAALLPFYVALDKGYFEQMGIKIELKELKSSTWVLNAIAAGELDGGTMSVLPLALAKKRGVPVKQVCSFGFSKPVDGIEGIAVLKDSPIRTVEDLEGKIVGGSFKPAEPYFWTVNILKRHGVKKYKYIEMSTADLAATLKAGTIDAAKLAEPWLTKMAGEIRIIDQCKDNLCCCGYCFGEKLLNEKPEVVKNWLHALRMGVGFIRENEMEARKILAKWTGVDEDVAMKMALKPWDDKFRIIADETEEQLGWLVENKMIDEKPTLKDIYDLRFVGRVTAKELREER